MAVRLRLRRTGSKNKPCFRIVAVDKRSPRDGRFIEHLGFYDPRHENEKIDVERTDYWIQRGAQPSKTVSSILKREKKKSESGVQEEENKPEVRESESEVQEEKAELQSEE